MQLLSLLLTLGVAQAFTGSRTGQVLRKSGHLQLQSSEAHSNHTEPKTLPTNLAIIADQCKCKFVGLCTCTAAVEFMDCVADACASGVCECQASDFVASCNGMVETCPQAELACSQEKATCTHLPAVSNESVEEITQELATLKERKCMLLNASEAGYLNAERRLKEIELVIQGKLDLLKERGVEAFYMGCTSSPSANLTVSWIGGEAERAFFLATDRKVIGAMAPLSGEGQQKRGWIIFGKITVYVLFVILAAFLYDRVRKNLVFPQVRGRDDHDGLFDYSLFACFQDWKLSAISCFCPALRWADTMDKANVGNESLISYWKGFALVLTLMALHLYIGLAALHPFCGMIVGLVLLGVNTVYRQKLRRRYSIGAGSFRTLIEDCFAWLCCPCCAMVQEARQVESTRVEMK